MTLVEVLVVIVVLGILWAMLMPRNNTPSKAPRITCLNNLHQLGLAYKTWEGDHGDKYPMEVSVTNGGVMEFIADGKNAWMVYLVMSNELSTPKVLICPADTERFPPAISFSTELVGRISYFVGLDASDAYPQMLISGDDNFSIGGIPVKPGLLQFSTNAPISWTAGRHRFAGNIGFADGSAQELSNSSLTNLFPQTGLATNRLAIP